MATRYIHVNAGFCLSTPHYTNKHKHALPLAHSIKLVQQLTLRIRNVDSWQADIVHLKQLKSLSQPGRRLISSCDYAATRSVQAFLISPAAFPPRRH